ncbi:uncharacterized protein LOC122267383 [Penaeus japonicus]|uniref:uncharacterized protein LOC122267383 n=1 Tax=Penaeus japonicus TaxID=27405 RepID=UPI001C716F87|nr:uncharacterized protein LOC122267383 [Penaeus japonicus]
MTTFLKESNDSAWHGSHQPTPLKTRLTTFLQTNQKSSETSQSSANLTQILLKRALNTLDQHQPREQAGFRPDFSTMGHIQTVSHPQEKTKEYSFPLWLVFVDYEKALDAIIEFSSLFTTLDNHTIEQSYLNYRETSITELQSRSNFTETVTK